MNEKDVTVTRGNNEHVLRVTWKEVDKFLTCEDVGVRRTREHFVGGGRGKLGDALDATFEWRSGGDDHF